MHETSAYRSLSAARKGSNTQQHLFIYDNSPQGQTISLTDSWTIHYVHDPGNPGVSKAYNEACAYAQRHEIGWMLLADQDTSFPEDIFNQYRLARIEDPGCRIFAPTLVDHAGIVSPYRRGIVGGKRLKTVSPGKVTLDDNYAINSGLIINATLFRAAGGYDERIRLDFSDVNFFRKLRPHAAYFRALDVVCTHTLSSSTDTKLLDALSRFIIYLEGSRITGRAFGNSLIFECHAILRALKLSWRYRSLRFFGSLLSSPS
jgi:GT2 family glycosyltransferase